MHTIMRINNKRLFLYFVPISIIMLFIYFVPIVNTVYSAFFDTTGSYAFIGLGNFEKIKSLILPTIWRTLVWTMGSILPAALLGLITALIFMKEFKAKKLLMSLCILPYTIPLIIVATAWTLMYQPDFGLINVFLLKVGLIDKPIMFLSTDYAMASVIVARIWRAMPFAFITYYAALRSIPIELYEAGDVDGTNAVQRLFYITLPQLASITATTLIILTVWTFLVFDIIFAMTGGGPVDATKIITIQIYRELFSMNDMGTASAFSLIAIVILIILTSIYWVIFKKGEVE